MATVQPDRITPSGDQHARRLGLIILVTVASALAAAGATALLVNIMERKQEKRHPCL